MTTSAQLIAALFSDKPAFQLKSGTGELRSSEDFFSTGAKDTSAMERMGHMINREKAEFIAKAVGPESVTVETGGGFSTVVFSACAKTHYCVNPDITANRLIVEYLNRYGFAGDNIVFVPESSDRGLASIPRGVKVDVAFIDGNHSFPYPIIDWHFIDQMLVAGSLLIIDDSQINAVKVLLEILDMEGDYQLTERLVNAYVYKKLNDRRKIGWGDQKLNKGKLTLKVEA